MTTSGFLMVGMDEAAELFELADVAVTKDMLLADLDRGAPIATEGKFDLIEYLAWMLENG